jgi:hypothetical protein
MFHQIKNMSSKIFLDFKMDFNQLNLRVKFFVIFSLFLGSLLRFFGFFNLGYYFDMIETQYTWGKYAHQMGGFWIFWRDYPMSKHFDYPIISLIYENFLYITSLPFGGSEQTFIVFLKSFNWIFDLVLLVFLYQIWKFRSKKSQNLTIQNNSNWFFTFIGLVYILPSTWFISAVWGQNDTLIVLFSLFSIWILFDSNLDSKYQNFLKSTNLNVNKKNKADFFNFQNFKFFLKSIFLDKNFLAGSFFAISFLIKPQPILVLPIILLYFFGQKTFKEIFKLGLWISPFLTFFWYGSTFYSQNQIFYDNSSFQFKFLKGILWKTSSNFYQISNWQIAANIGFWLLTLILFSLFLAEINSFFNSKNLYKNSELSLKLTSTWQKLRRFGLGFFLIFDILNLPLLILNYQRFARVLFAPFIREDKISFGAANLWNLLDKKNESSEVLLSFYQINITVSLAGYLIFAILNIWILAKITDLNWQKIRTLKFEKVFGKELKLVDLVYFMMIFTSSYFLFLTKMHSRYLHFGIILSFISYIFLPINFMHKKAWLITTIFFSFGYFLNQLVVFSTNNSEPIWTRDFGKIFNLDLMNLSSIISLICFSFFYYFINSLYDQSSQKSQAEK